MTLTGGVCTRPIPVELGKIGAAGSLWLRAWTQEQCHVRE